MGKTFIDTNILAYAYDRHDPLRQKRSRAVLRQLASDGGVISTQVLQELYVVLVRKLGVDPLVAKELLQSLQQFEVVLVTPELIHTAIDTQILHRLNFWDALIVSAAAQAKCARLWTEDLNAGQQIHGVLVENPLGK